MAKVKVKIDKRAIKRVRKRAARVLPTLIQELVLGSISRGISPVQGQRKFKKYSESYKDVIRNRAAFRVINGKTVAVSLQKQRKVDKFASPLSQQFARQENRSIRSRNAQKKKTINRWNSEFKKHGKKISPVNMKLSGELIKSFFVKVKKNRITLGFRNKLADIHNRLGPGGKKSAVRRLLPTRPNERFNRNITLELRRTLVDIIKKVI